MTDRPADVPPFEIGGVTWTCFSVDDGRYEWRSACGRLAVTRSARAWIARADGKRIGEDQPTPKAAMLAALTQLPRLASAAAPVTRPATETAA